MAGAVPAFSSAGGNRRSVRQIFILVLVAVTLMVIDKNFAGPTDWMRGKAQDTFASATSSISGLWPNRQTEVTQLQGENAALRAQLQAAQGQLLASADQRRQLSDLSTLLNMATPDNVARVIAPVTATGLSNFDSAIEIGKGTNAGVKVGNPVVSGSGLVGRVVQTSADRSTVVLLTDSTFEVGVRYANAGDVGVVSGGGSGNELRGDLIDLESKVAVGEVAVTNGQQHSRFPAGIPVGTVKSNDAQGQDLRRSIYLTSATDFGHLNNLAVLLWEPQS